MEGPKVTRSVLATVSLGRIQPRGRPGRWPRREHAGVPKQRLSAVPCASRPKRSGGEVPAHTAQLRVQPARPPRCTRRPGEAQRQHSSPSDPRPAPLRQPRPARPGGAEGARPQPAETALEEAPGPHQRAGGEESAQSAQPAPVSQRLCSPRGAPLPCSSAPLRTSALTSRQRGTVVDRDPDLLYPALSQLQGHLHSLDSAALPLRRIQTWGSERRVDPQNKGKEGLREGARPRRFP